MNFTLFSVLYWACAAVIALMVLYPEKSEKIINKIIGGIKH